MKSVKPLLYIFSFFAIYVSLLWVTSFPSIEKPLLSLLSTPTIEIMRNLYPEGMFASKSILEKDRTELLIGVKSREEVERAGAQARNNHKEFATVSFRGRLYYLDNFTIPFFLFIALSLITPVAPRAKLKYIALGTGILYIYFLFRICVLLRYEMAIAGMPEFFTSVSTGKILHTLSRILELGFSIFTALFTWILLLFRNSTWYPTLLQAFKSIENIGNKGEDG